MPPKRLLKESAAASAAEPQSVSAFLQNDVLDSALRSSSPSLQPSSEKTLLSQRASTWPLGADAKGRALQEGRIDEVFYKGEIVETLPRQSTRTLKPRTRFSLPTIEELQTYERDPEFARLEDRPKRGLNLPRSKSVKPSTMSKLLLDLDDRTVDEDAIASEQFMSPRSVASPTMKQAFSTDSSPMSISLSMIEASLPAKQSIRRSADSPGTPIVASFLPLTKGKPGFFKNEQ